MGLARALKSRDIPATPMMSRAARLEKTDTSIMLEMEGSGVSAEGAGGVVVAMWIVRTISSHLVQIIG